MKQPDSVPRGSSESDGEGDSDKGNRSRNAKKREAQRAVRWGIELAKCSPPQIKRILRVAALQEDVYDALMLVKRLGPDVREGKPRQFSYIGHEHRALKILMKVTMRMRRMTLMPQMRFSHSLSRKDEEDDDDATGD